MLRTSAVLLLLVLFSGCGTLVSLPGMQPYGGVQKNFRTADSRLSGTGDKLVSVADMPLSFCLDTLLLPVTVPVWLASGSEPEVVVPQTSNLDLAFETVASADIRFDLRP